MIDIVWDMETNDPDDFITLLMLAGHPQVNLKAVTILPGSPAQVGFVRHALNNWFDMDIPIGARNLASQKSRVSDWHYLAYGNVAESLDALPSDEVLRQNCDADTILLTGAALTNIRTAIRKSEEANEEFIVGSIVVQGGFAGEGVVPLDLQMEKFKGLVMCPTHNLMGDKKAAHLVLEHGGFGTRRFVSKNVCHRVVYDQTMHKSFEQLKDKSVSLTKIWQGMEVYLNQVNPSGKMLHDPLAATCAINPKVVSWAEVALFREGSEWGSRPLPESNTWISIDYDHDLFFSIMTEV